MAMSSHCVARVPETAVDGQVGRTSYTRDGIRRALVVHPDSMTQVGMISTQHVEPSKATRGREVTDYTGIDEFAPSKNERNDPIDEKVVNRTLAGFKVDKVATCRPYWRVGPCKLRYYGPRRGLALGSALTKSTSCTGRAGRADAWHSERLRGRSSSRSALP